MKSNISQIIMKIFYTAEQFTRKEYLLLRLHGKIFLTKVVFNKSCKNELNQRLVLPETI